MFVCILVPINIFFNLNRKNDNAPVSFFIWKKTNVNNFTFNLVSYYTCIKIYININVYSWKIKNNKTNTHLIFRFLHAVGQDMPTSNNTQLNQTFGNIRQERDCACSKWNARKEHVGKCSRLIWIKKPKIKLSILLVNGSNHQ